MTHLCHVKINSQLKFETMFIIISYLLKSIFPTRHNIETEIRPVPEMTRPVELPAAA
jgi:hypothetical protein